MNYGETEMGPEGLDLSRAILGKTLRIERGLEFRHDRSAIKILAWEAQRFSIAVLYLAMVKYKETVDQQQSLAKELHTDLVEHVDAVLRKAPNGDITPDDALGQICLIQGSECLLEAAANERSNLASEDFLRKQLDDRLTAFRETVRAKRADESCENSRAIVCEAVVQLMLFRAGCIGIDLFRTSINQVLEALHEGLTQLRPLVQPDADPESAAWQANRCVFNIRVRLGVLRTEYREFMPDVLESKPGDEIIRMFDQSVLKEASLCRKIALMSDGIDDAFRQLKEEVTQCVK